MSEPLDKMTTWKDEFNIVDGKLPETNLSLLPTDIKKLINFAENPGLKPDGSGYNYKELIEILETVQNSLISAVDVEKGKREEKKEKERGSEKIKNLTLLYELVGGEKGLLREAVISDIYPNTVARVKGLIAHLQSVFDKPAQMVPRPIQLEGSLVSAAAKVFPAIPKERIVGYIDYGVYPLLARLLPKLAEEEVIAKATPEIERLFKIFNKKLEYLGDSIKVIHARGDKLSEGDADLLSFYLSQIEKYFIEGGADPSKKVSKVLLGTLLGENLENARVRAKAVAAEKREKEKKQGGDDNETKKKGDNSEKHEFDFAIAEKPAVAIKAASDLVEDRALKDEGNLMDPEKILGDLKEVRQLEVIQLLLVLPEKSETYEKLVPRLIDAKELDEESGELLRALLKLENPPDLPLTKDQILKWPNLFRQESNSREFYNLSNCLLTEVDEKKLSINVMKFLSNLIAQKDSELKLSSHIMYLALSALLREYYGVNGDRLDIEQRNDTKNQIKLFLYENSTPGDQIPKELVQPLKVLQRLLLSSERALRLQGRGICEELHIPLTLSEMLYLSVDGVVQGQEIKRETEDLVLVIGPSGAGKSTLINYLSGIEYLRMVDPLTGEPYLQPAPGQRIPPARVGHSIYSQTLYPQIITPEKEGCSYCDCPGFSDNRESEEAVCASLGVPLAVQSAKRIQAVIIVLEWQTTELHSAGRGEAFRQLSQTLARLIKNPVELFTKSDKTKRVPLLFAISKPPSDRMSSASVEQLKKQLINRLLKILKERKEFFTTTVKNNTLKLNNLRSELQDINLILKVSKSFFSKKALLSGQETAIGPGLFSRLVIGIAGESEAIEKGRLEKIIKDQGSKWKKEGLTMGAVEELQRLFRIILPLDTSKGKAVVDKQQKQWKVKARSLQNTINDVKLIIENVSGEHEILKLMLERDDNIFIIRGVRDEKEQKDQREALLQYLAALRREKCEVRKDQFIFDPLSKEYAGVRKWLMDFAYEFLPLVMGLPMLLNRLFREEVQIRLRAGEIEKYRRELEYEMSPSSLKPVKKNPLGETIAAKENELKELKEQLDKQGEQRDKLLRECKNIEEAPEIEYASRFTKESRSWLGSSWLGHNLGIKTTWSYHFPGSATSGGFFGFFASPTAIIPISRYEKSCTVDAQNKLIFFNSLPSEVREGDDFRDHAIVGDPSQGTQTGTFTIDEYDKEKGKLRLTYYSNAGKDGVAGVRVFVLPKDLPDNKKKIEQFSNEIQEINKLMLAKEKESFELEQRLKKDRERSEIIRLDLGGDQDRVKRIRILLYRLGWDKEKYINHFFSTVEEQNCIEWLAKKGNFELIQRFSNCNTEQWTSLNQEKVVMDHVFGLKEVGGSAGFLTIELEKLKTQIPKDFFDQIREIVNKRGLTLPSLYAILDFMNQPSVEVESSTSVAKLLADLELKKNMLQYCFEKLKRKYLSHSFQISTFHAIISLMDFSHDESLSEFIQQYKEITNKNVLEVSYPPLSKEEEALVIQMLEKDGTLYEKFGLTQRDVMPLIDGHEHGKESKRDKEIAKYNVSVSSKANLGLESADSRRPLLMSFHATKISEKKSKQEAPPGHAKPLVSVERVVFS